MDMGLSCKICLLSALLSILATLAGLMYHMSGSVLSVHEQPHVEGSDDILQYYEKTDLARFVKKNQRELLLAQKDRRLECGTIVDVSDIECEFCALLVNVLRTLVMLGNETQEYIAEFSTIACIDLQIEHERVCKTVVEEFKGELFWVLLRLSYSSEEVCSSVLGTDCGGPVTMWNVTFPDVPKPPVVPPSLPPPGFPTISVLHITDYHLDAEYQAGSNAQCGEPLCCREDDGPPGPGEAGAGKYGDYQKCDAAPIAVDNLFKHLISIEDSVVICKRYRPCRYVAVVHFGATRCRKCWRQSKHENTITGQFFGHEHSMRYQVFYDEETLKRPLGVSFLPGSITTYTKLNPGYRIYEIDGNYQNSSWRVLDYTNYFMNLTHANLFDEVIWQKEYSAKEAYGLNSLFPQDWNDLIYRMKADDNLFKLFCTYSSKSAPNECDKCTGNCKRDFLCNLKTARNGDPNICKDL